MTNQEFLDIQLWLAQHIIKDAIIRKDPASNHFELRITAFLNTIPANATDILPFIKIQIQED